MAAWQLWELGEVLLELDDIQPRLASWNAKTHPDQVRLSAYLENLTERLGPLPEQGLALHLAVQVHKEANLSRHHDLENYLTPIVGHLGHKRFHFVSATKHLEGGSRLQIGWARPRSDPLQGWEHFSCKAGGGAHTKEWKASLHQALMQSYPILLPPGPVAVHLAWRCASRRNWVALWKPTGDAIGPVLGEQPVQGRDFNPNDDRIVTLGLHLNEDDALGNGVVVGMWWRGQM